MSVIPTTTIEMTIPGSDGSVIGGSVGANMGYAAATNGTVIAIGAYGQLAQGSGDVYMYNMGGTLLQRIPGKAAGTTNFGASTAISGNRMLVGDIYYDAGPGSVYTYDYSGTAWAASGTLVPADGTAGAGFGLGYTPISIDGTVCVVGATYANSTGGAAYVFTNNGTTWTQAAKLEAGTVVTSEYFGNSVWISGSVIAIGARGNNDTPSFIPELMTNGAAYVFTGAGTAWSQAQRFQGDTPGYGASVYTNGGTVMVGASDQYYSSGSVNIYTGTPGSYALYQNITNGSDTSGFGARISFDGTSLAISNASQQNVSLLKLFGSKFVRMSEISTGTASSLVTPVVSGDTLMIGDYGAGSNGVGWFYDLAWTDVTEDVIRPISVKYGIFGNTLNDRTAGTGQIRFKMNNSASNSAGVEGYYSPGHSNVRAGFAPGIRARVKITDGSNTKIITGKIPADGIIADAGQYGERTTSITALDWMNEAANHQIQLQELQTDKEISQVVQSVVEEMTHQPLSTNYNTGQSTFAYSLDTVGKQTFALTEFQKMAITEGGYIYLKRDDTYGEVLTVDGRHTRAARTSGFTFDNTQLGLESTYGGNYANILRFTAYPRQIDDAATTVLASLKKEIEIESEQTVTIIQKYRDPTGGSSNVSGTEMVTPQATTDYLMNAVSGGGGSDITSDLTVTANYGAEGVQWELTNNGSVTGFITKLQARGKGIYFFDPIQVEERDESGILQHGERLTTVNQAYQDNVLRSISAIRYWYNRLKVLRQDVSAITWTPNRDAAHLEAFLTMDIGDVFTIAEEITGVNEDYYINGIDFDVFKGEYIVARWTPSIAAGGDFWVLGTSELGISTVLAY